MQGDQDSRSGKKVYVARRIFAVLVVLALLALLAPRACQAFFGSGGDLSSSGTPEAVDSSSSVAGDEEEAGSAEDDASSNEQDAESSSDSADSLRDDDDGSERAGEAAMIEDVGGTSDPGVVDLAVPVVGLEAPIVDVSTALPLDAGAVDPGLLPAEVILPVSLEAPLTDAAAPVAPIAPVPPVQPPALLPVPLTTPNAPVQPAPVPVPLAAPAAPIELAAVTPEPTFAEEETYLLFEEEFVVFEEESIAAEQEPVSSEGGGGELVVVVSGGATAVAHGGNATAVAGGAVAVS